MAQKTREQLNTANAALFVNNSTGNITPVLEKAFNEDVNDSAVNIKGDTFAADAEFAFQNGSKLREGAIPHGFGGGIARVCANEKADQWEDGFKYLISTSGSTNTVIYTENINNDNPEDTDDETLSYAVGSRWKNLSTGIEYLCTQANEGDAIWVPLSGTWTPSLTIQAAITDATASSALYSRVGDVVTCTVFLTGVDVDFASGNTSGSIRIDNVPFYTNTGAFIGGVVGIQGIGSDTLITTYLVDNVGNCICHFENYGGSFTASGLSVSVQFQYLIN